jgi:hypothetical protein
MKIRVWNVLLLFAVGIITTGGYAQDEALHAPYGLEVATVEVRVWTHLDHIRHNPDRDVRIYRAAGFTADGCDIVTPWAIMVDYERRHDWPSIRAAIKITVAGGTYDGELRPVGPDALNAGLACVDFSPLPPGAYPVTFPLALEKAVPPAPVYGESLSGLMPGTPLLNEKGRIVGVLVTNSEGFTGFVYAADLAAFLRLASTVPRPGPHLSFRPPK